MAPEWWFSIWIEIGRLANDSDRTFGRCRLSPSDSSQIFQLGEQGSSLDLVLIVAFGGELFAKIVKARVLSSTRKFERPL